MKLTHNHNQKKRHGSAFFAFLTLTSIVFASCHDVIFDEVRKEVKLEDAQVSGDINAIVRYQLSGTEQLFVQNGNIWHKDISESPTWQAPYTGKWEKASKAGMGTVVKLAADSTYLYALSANITEDNDEGENIVTGRSIFYTTDAETWTAVEIAGETALSSSISLFCTNAPQNDHRFAYARVGTTVYKLNGATATIEKELDTTAYNATWAFTSAPSTITTTATAFDGTISATSGSGATLTATGTLAWQKAGMLLSGERLTNSVTVYTNTMGALLSGSADDCTDKATYQNADTVYKLTLEGQATVLFLYSGVTAGGAASSVFAIESPDGNLLMSEGDLKGGVSEYLNDMPLYTSVSSFQIAQNASVAGTYTIYVNNAQLHLISLSNTTNVDSAAYFAGEVHFSGGYAMATDESVEKDATVLYASSGTAITYTKDGATWATVSPDTGTIYALAPTNDYLLLGTSVGLTTVALTEGVPASSTTAAKANASSALSSSYRVYSVIAIDPALAEDEGDIYATATYTGSSSSSSATRSKEGLWAYYPGRNEWNLE